MATEHVQTPLEGWEAAYRATPERDAPFTTLSGEPIRPLYTEGDLPDQGHGIQTLADDGSYRLFDQFEEAVRGCK